MLSILHLRFAFIPSCLGKKTRKINILKLANGNQCSYVFPSLHVAWKIICVNSLPDHNEMLKLKPQCEFSNPNINSVAAQHFNKRAQLMCLFRIPSRLTLFMTCQKHQLSCKCLLYNFCLVLTIYLIHRKREVLG